MVDWNAGSAYAEDLDWPYLMVKGERVQVRLDYDIHGYFLVNVYGYRYPPSQEGGYELIEKLMQENGKGIRGG